MKKATKKAAALLMLARCLPEAAEEKTVSYQVPAGVFISGPDFYTDPACTQPYDITNRPTGDLTVYVRAGDF